MHMFKRVLAIILLVNNVRAVIRPSAKLYLIEGEGFIAYLEVPKSFGGIENCWFKFRDDNKVKIELNSSEAIITARGESVLPFSDSICGIRVNKLSSASAAIWMLEAENVYGDFEQAQLSVQILPPQKTRIETHVQREIGQGSLACTKSEQYTKHCKIVEDSGETWNKCELYTTIRPNKSVECLTYNWGRMGETHERIIVDIKNGSVYTTASVTESDRNVVMRCQFPDSLFSCQAEMPDHKSEIYIMEGLYNGRYSAYDTTVSKSQCALEIPKPLEAKEIGLWRMLNYESNIPSGCLFYIGKDKKEIIEKELEGLDKVSTMKVYKPGDGSNGKIEEMGCAVPFVIDDCYLRDPNNTVYFPDSIRFQRHRMYGKCVFRDLPVIAGIWTCGARGHDYEKEVLQNIEVIIKSERGEVLTDFLKAKRGNTVELMCVSAFEQPLSHCAFIDPQGHVHLVGTANSKKTAGHVQYFGRGLQWGECGAKITETNVDDFGQWKCQFITYARRLESSFTMELKESAIGQATSVGLGIGLTIIVLLIAGVVIGTIFYRRRNLSAQHDFTSAEQLDMSASTSHMSTTAA